MDAVETEPGKSTSTATTQQEAFIIIIIIIIILRILFLVLITMIDTPWASSARGWRHVLVARLRLARPGVRRSVDTIQTVARRNNKRQQ
jgi:hypothetical protein